MSWQITTQTIFYEHILIFIIILIILLLLLYSLVGVLLDKCVMRNFGDNK